MTEKITIIAEAGVNHNTPIVILLDKDTKNNVFNIKIICE